MKTPSLSEEKLRELFDQNFERLRLENGHSLAPDVRESAWEQVRCYWRKLGNIAASVTDTEVKLNLPNQKTVKRRVFCIEGVVDIVREQGRITMYDLKTHDLTFVRTNIGLYRDQLNVYAHIWQKLRGESLNETAIIATPVPPGLSAAIKSGDATRIDGELAKWDPVVSIDFDAANVKKTISEFAAVVDQIEDHEFHPPPLVELTKKEADRGTFATRVCRNCDVRFSCDSYRGYANKYRDRGWSKFADFYDLEPQEEETLARYNATSGVDDGVTAGDGE